MIMTNDCLVRELKKSISNENLPLLGKMVIDIPIPVTDSRALQLYFNKNTTITLQGDGHFTDSTGTQNYGKSLDYSTPGQVLRAYVSQGTHDKVLIDKYAVTGIVAGVCIINFNDLDFSPIDSLDLTGSNNTGSLAKVLENNTLVYLTIRNTTNAPSLEDLAKGTHLVSIDMNNASPISGNLEAMLVSQLTTGNRTSGEMSMQFNGTGVKFNSLPFSDRRMKAVFSATGIACINLKNSQTSAEYVLSTDTWTYYD